MRKHLTARRGWTALFFGVLAYEALAPKGELLSEGADRGIERHPYAVRALFIITALHLSNLLNPKFDPFTQVHTCVGLGLGGLWVSGKSASGTGMSGETCISCSRGDA